MEISLMSNYKLNIVFVLWNYIFWHSVVLLLIFDTLYRWSHSGNYFDWFKEVSEGVYRTDRKPNYKSLLLSLFWRGSSTRYSLGAVMDRPNYGNLTSNYFSHRSMRKKEKFQNNKSGLKINHFAPWFYPRWHPLQILKKRTYVDINAARAAK